MFQIFSNNKVPELPGEQDVDETKSTSTSIETKKVDRNSDRKFLSTSMFLNTNL